jgi:hypothetical protein
MGRWIWGLLLLVGCAEVTASGSGTLSHGAQQRLEQLDESARREATLRALTAAEQHPEDLRSQRKAAELVQSQLTALRGDESRSLYQKTRPVLERLESHPEACTTRVEAGRVRAAAADHETAARNFVTSARDCRSVPAFLQAGWPLKQLNRCNEVIELAKWVWSSSEKEQWVPILDTVAACSNAVTLQTNLSFVPRAVLLDYYLLLDRRERERERREREYEAARVRDQGRWNCASSCSSAVSQCSVGCRGDSYCWSRCEALGSACRAGCY